MRKIKTIAGEDLFRGAFVYAKTEKIKFKWHNPRTWMYYEKHILIRIDPGNILASKDIIGMITKDKKKNDLVSIKNYRDLIWTDNFCFEKYTEEPSNAIKIYFRGLV